MVSESMPANVLYYKDDGFLQYLYMPNSLEYAYYKGPNGKLIRVTGFYGLVSPCYVLENDRAYQFSGYRLIAKDLDLIKEAYTAFIATKDNNINIVNQSLTFFIAITYGKCFAAAQGRKVKLDAESKSALKLATPEEKSLHDKIIEFRNQHVAHSGIIRYEESPVTLVIHPSKSGDFEYKVYDSPQFISSIFPNEEIFIGLIDKLSEYVDYKISKVYDSIIEDVKKNITVEEFVKKSFKPNLNDVKTISDFFK